jgi:hypothetical protein
MMLVNVSAAYQRCSLVTGPLTSEVNLEISVFGLAERRSPVYQRWVAMHLPETEKNM